jgi:hypothetical protein
MIRHIALIPIQSGEQQKQSFLRIDRFQKSTIGVSPMAFFEYETTGETRETPVIQALQDAPLGIGPWAFAIDE